MASRRQGPAPDPFDQMGEGEPVSLQDADKLLFGDMDPTIPLDQLRLDGGTQPRAELDQDTIAEYAEDMARGDRFPPVTVFHDGTDFWLADGFHRVHAARQADLEAVRADVKQGTRRDAVLASVGVNAAHGKRRANADKRRAVLTLLEDDEWTTWSDREIARRCRVSNTFVSNMRHASLSTVDSERTYTTKHGTTARMDTGGIRDASQQRAQQPQDGQPFDARRGRLLRLLNDVEGTLREKLRFLDRAALEALLELERAGRNRANVVLLLERRLEWNQRGAARQQGRDTEPRPASVRYVGGEDFDQTPDYEDPAIDIDEEFEEDDWPEEPPVSPQAPAHEVAARPIHEQGAGGDAVSDQAQWAAQGDAVTDRDPDVNYAITLGGQLERAAYEALDALVELRQVRGIRVLHLLGDEWMQRLDHTLAELLAMADGTEHETGALDRVQELRNKLRVMIEHGVPYDEVEGEAE